MQRPLTLEELLRAGGPSLQGCSCLSVELQDRIRNAGITHWALWEYGKRSAEEWAAALPDTAGVSSHLQDWLRQGKRRSASVPGLMVISEGSSFLSVLRQILTCLHLEQTEKNEKILMQLLQTPLEYNTPVLLLVLKEAATLLPSELPLLHDYPGLQILDHAGTPVALPEGS